MLPMLLGYMVGIAAYIVFGPWILLLWLIKKIRSRFV